MMFKAGYVLMIVAFVMFAWFMQGEVDTLRRENLHQQLISAVVPDCPEDSVLLGVGEFNGLKWTMYVCGPSTDDYRGKP